MSSSSLWPGGSEPPPRLALHQEQAVAWINQRLDRYGGVILADEAGLGKSWVAATVAAERLRNHEKVDLVVPASLQSTWKEVCSAFGLDCCIVTHEVVRRSPASETAASFIVVDEAHRFRNQNTKGWARLAHRLLGTRSLLLTATPIWNAPTDLLELLRLLVADDALKTAGVASIEQGLGTEIGRARIVEQLLLRRDSTVVPANLFNQATRNRKILYDTPAAWSRIVDLIRTLRFPHCLGYSRSILTHLMIRRLHSSPAALQTTVQRQLRFCRTGLDLLRDGYRLNRREFTRFLVVDDDVQELLFPQLFLEPEDEPDAKDLQDEIERLESLLSMVRELGSPKRQQLMELISTEPLPSLIFVGAVDTAKDLLIHLSTISTCGAATGGSCRSRGGGTTIAELTVEFQTGRLDHLILTDLGGEGLNLQRAGRVIHYDLPWSPMRIEQRNGRARRIGRHGRPLDIVVFSPRVGELPTLTVLDRKRKASDEFWSASDPQMSSHPSLERLPPRITASQPQLDLWKRSPGSVRGDWLLRRYRAGIETMMAKANTPREIEELRRTIEEDGG